MSAPLPLATLPWATPLATQDDNPSGWWRPVLLLVAIALLVYVAMWWGWRRRGRRHALPPLPQAAGMPSAYEETEGRYFGTTVHGDWLDRVVAQGLGNRSDVTLRLSELGLDVDRPTRGTFQIPRAALVGAGTASGIAGKVIPPHGVLVVTWTHGDLTLDSGFRLRDGNHEEWVEKIEKLVKEHTE